VVWLNWDSFRLSPLTETKILCGWAKPRFLSRIPFNQNKTPVCDLAKLRFLSPIPFNQNPNPICGLAKLRFISPISLTRIKMLCMVRLNWDSFRQSPLTRIKILCVVRLNWDSFRQSPLTRTQILCVIRLNWDSFHHSLWTKTKMLLIRACFRCWSHLLCFRVVHGFKSLIVVTLSLCKCGLVYFLGGFHSVILGICVLGFLK